MAEQDAIPRVVVNRFEPSGDACIAGMSADDGCRAELIQRAGGGEQFQLDLVLSLASRSDRSNFAAGSQ